MATTRKATTASTPPTPVTKKAAKAAKTTPAQTGADKIAAIKVERMKIGDLKPHPRNPRQHPDPDSAEWKVLEASLAHDYFDPVVWNVRNGQLVSGHLRTKVLKRMGYKQVDVVVVDYDEPTHVARLMAANKAIGENDLPKMKELFGELRDMPSFDFSLSGFTFPEMNELFGDTVTPSDNDSAINPGPEGAGAVSPESEEGKARLLAVTSAIGKPKVEAQVNTCWRVGEHVLFCQPLVSGPWKWAALLDRMQHNAEGKKVIFIPCPDPYVLLTEKDIIIIAVQPDAFVASHALSNYIATHGKASVAKVANPDTLAALT